MGSVFLAVDERLQRLVAVKVLPPHMSRDAGSVQRFQNEAQAAAQLDHENVARVHFVGSDQGLHYIAFEYIRGINIRDLIARNGKLSPEDAVNYTLQIASALAHMSSQKVVHRDIKPSNIIVTPSGRAKLVDLGLARNELREGAEPLTVPGTTLGTFDYISPEQAKDPRQVDVRSDIYSLGCTLYHMLTGEPPYPEGTMLQKLLDHQAKGAPDPRRKNRKVSSDLAAIVEKMMASDPRRRYQSAEQLLRDLMLIAGSMGLRSASTEGLVWLSPMEHRPSFIERNAGWIVTAALLLLMVGYLNHINNTDREFSSNSSSERTASNTKPEEKKSQTSTTEKSKSSPAQEIASGKNLISLFPNQTNPPVYGTGVFGQNDSALLVQPLDTPGGNGQTESVSKPPVKAIDGIVLVSENGTEKSFRTLEAACAAAADGSVIELRFNGLRKEGPARIQKKVSIRSGKGFTPTLQFVPNEVPGEGWQTRMFTILSGSLELSDLHLLIDSSERGGSDDWGVFSIDRPDYVRLRNVIVTVRNPRYARIAVAEFKSVGNRMEADMEMPNINSLKVPECDFSQCLIRGDADLVIVRNTNPARISLLHTVVGLTGKLINYQGGIETPTENSKFEIRLERSTLALGGPFLNVESGDLPRKMTQIRISANHSIFTTNGGQPLISMTGNLPVEDFRRQLTWEGLNNYYDGLQTFWSIVPTDDSQKPSNLDFEGWITFWGRSVESNPFEGKIRWDRPWSTRPFEDLAPNDFRLNRVIGTIDAGADILLLSRLPWKEIE